MQLDDYRQRRALKADPYLSVHREREAVDELKIFARQERDKAQSALQEVQQSVNEIARAVIEQMTEQRREIEVLRGQVRELTARPFSHVAQDLVLTSEEWTALGEIMSDPTPAPEWLRKAVREE